ncbi:hypothetical protein GCM10027057_25770 [Marisediminicola antarctica]|uniref:Uncharacterized protein n=1 Tax=Marisediminicola antarctica TaxID=674079 RepID=A0A7L5AJW0_9MICO|nr:hypothetical protein BHD05_12505 [Marisediminicola antarctica]
MQQLYIPVHEFGHEGSAGFDSDGFFISLIAEGLKIDGGVTLRVFPNDHPPARLHVDIRARSSYRSWPPGHVGVFTLRGSQPKRHALGGVSGIFEGHMAKAVMDESLQAAGLGPLEPMSRVLFRCGVPCMTDGARVHAGEIRVTTA